MAAWSDPPSPAGATPSRFAVLVTLVNGQGHRTKLLGFGPSTSAAIDNATLRMRAATADESWDSVAWEEA